MATKKQAVVLFFFGKILLFFFFEKRIGKIEKSTRIQTTTPAKIKPKREIFTLTSSNIDSNDVNILLNFGLCRWFYIRPEINRTPKPFTLYKSIFKLITHSESESDIASFRVNDFFFFLVWYSISFDFITFSDIAYIRWT